MHMKTRDLQPVSDWTTLRFERNTTGYAVAERGQARGGIRGDRAPRQAGVAMIVASGLAWLLAPAVSAAEAVSHGAAAALLCGMGLTFVALSCRRGVRTIQVNFRARHLCLESGAARGCGRLLHVVPFECIDSLYLRRPDNGSMATLFLRQNGGKDELDVMRGPLAELETLHRKLSRDITQAMAASEDKVTPMPVRPVRPRRVLPRSERRIAERQLALVASA